MKEISHTGFKNNEKIWRDYLEQNNENNYQSLIFAGVSQMLALTKNFK